MGKVRKSKNSCFVTIRADRNCHIYIYIKVLSVSLLIEDLETDAVSISDEYKRAFCLV